MTYVYVLDKAGNPLMPTTRYGWVCRALKSGKAKAVTTVPFTIRLTYDPAAHEMQPVILGIDPGRTNIGLAAVSDIGKCLYSAHCETRNREIPKLMAKRREHRQASRRGERLARKRLAKRLGTTMQAVLSRLLPGYEKPVPVKNASQGLYVPELFRRTHIQGRYAYRRGPVRHRARAGADQFR